MQSLAQQAETSTLGIWTSRYDANISALIRFLTKNCEESKTRWGLRQQNATHYPVASSCLVESFASVETPMSATTNK